MACDSSCDGCARLLRRWPDAAQPGGICSLVEIQRKIWDLADRCVPADAEGFQAHHFARAGARIIHGFLRIHPFADVNGRVARMLFRALVLRSGGRFEPLPTDEREEGDRRDAYLAALRSADDILSESEGTSREAGAHDLLADWLLPMVMPVILDDDEGASRGF